MLFPSLYLLFPCAVCWGALMGALGVVVGRVVMVVSGRTEDDVFLNLLTGLLRLGTLYTEGEMPCRVWVPDFFRLTPAWDVWSLPLVWLAGRCMFSLWFHVIPRCLFHVCFYIVFNETKT